jgi:putative transposase
MEIVRQRRLSIGLVCKMFAISQSCYRYEATKNAENESITNWLMRRTDNHRNWGFGLCFFVFAQCQRVQMEPHAGLSDLPSARDLSLPALRVIDSLNQIIAWRGKPKVIRSLSCKNRGSQNISEVFKQWAKQSNIELRYTQPGHPQQNAYVERFNRTVRYEWLNQYLWRDIEQVQEHATRWTWCNPPVFPYQSRVEGIGKLLYTIRNGCHSTERFVRTFMIVVLLPRVSDVA